MASADASPEPRPLAYPRTFLLIVAGIFAVDQVTKLVAVDALSATYVPREVLGDVLRWTLVYNPGAAFGLHLGANSRWIFMALTVGALILLSRLYVETRPGDWPRALSIALVSGGAMGNLLDRIRSARGVVDFIDVGIGASRWPTFNVADMAVSCGAILLAWVLWREDVQRHRNAEAAPKRADEPAAAGGTAGANGPDAPVQG
jgi:signal peptidase II